MSIKISKFVKNKFNISAIRGTSLYGNQKIHVIFKINKVGKVTEVKARAAHPLFEAEAVRIIRQLPFMIPGEQFGQPVIVPYSLPITFFLKKPHIKKP